MTVRSAAVAATTVDCFWVGVIVLGRGKKLVDHYLGQRAGAERIPFFLSSLVDRTQELGKNIEKGEFFD